ncbi:WSCD family member CG9164 isoform X2 [Plodia interpunctella]|uniref:WSCD family member CG9164 isoform X2 n=1 Tax=Plodia interpunctella TaxID=58824 RepID=UPI002368C1CE|nr:WSCD family member CG9164 isoform X2 [Plodia interpunctella]
MSRKSVFLLAATVVMLYFSIILFMLSPLHGAKSIVTGSIYMDYGLKAHGFPAENMTDGSVLIVKTHGVPPLDSESYKFHSAVLLIRNPRDAILADYNRLYKGHIGTAPKYVFKKRSPNSKISDWAAHVYQQLRDWEGLHYKWLSQFPGAIHIVFYEVLVRETRKELNKILQFLNYTVSEEDMNCAMLNKEGIYRRKKKFQDFDPYTKDMYKGLDKIRQRILRLINVYQKKNNVTFVGLKGYL